MKCYLGSSLNRNKFPECEVPGYCSFRTTANVVHLYGIFLFLVRNFLDKFSVTRKLNHTFDTEIGLLCLIQFLLDILFPGVKIKTKINFLGLSAIPLRGI